jgi:hypothetical protein
MAGQIVPDALRNKFLEASKLASIAYCDIQGPFPAPFQCNRFCSESAFSEMEFLNVRLYAQSHRKRFLIGARYLMKINLTFYQAT